MRRIAWPPIEEAGIIAGITKGRQCSQASQEKGRDRQRPVSVFRSLFRFVLCFVIRTEHFAGLGIDQMDARARGTGDRLIAFIGPLGRIVGDPALHVQSRIGTAVEESGHGVVAPATG